MISAGAEVFSYPARMAPSDRPEAWPEAGRRLLDLLSGNRSSLALIVGQQEPVDSLVDRLSADLDLDGVKLGHVLAESDLPPTSADVDAAVGSAPILRDLEVLMWPSVGIPLVPFLRHRARTTPTIAVWPGEISGGKALFSRPGRPDYYEARLDGVTVLRPVATSFPDEVPYTIERSPA